MSITKTLRTVPGVLALVAAGLCATGLAQATMIPIDNPGFETDVYPLGGYGAGITGWTTPGDINAAATARGTIHPAAGQFFLGQPVEGNNVAYSNGGEIYQVLSAALAANTEYLLRVNVGNRKRQPPNFAGYTVKLLAGNTVLGTESSLAPRSGEILTSTIAYSALPGDPNLGQLLKILLLSSGSQASFDDVKLDVTVSAPSPATGLLFIVGTMVLMLSRAARIKT